jgi:hypothetical protein
METLSLRSAGLRWSLRLIAAGVLASSILVAVLLPSRHVDFVHSPCGIKGDCQVLDDGIDHRTSSRIWAILAGTLIAGSLCTISFKMRQRSGPADSIDEMLT